MAIFVASIFDEAINKDILLNIIVDYREQESGIIELLKERNVDIEVKKIPHGDYIINNWITVERKTAKDFLVSIISRRLFYQLTNLKEHCDCPIPIIFSCSKDDTRNIFYMIGKQDNSNAESVSLRGGYRPKKLKKGCCHILSQFPKSLTHQLRN